MRFSIVVGVAIAIVYAATSVSGAVSADGAPKPVFLYAGPKDDAGWHQSVDHARTKLESALQVTIPYVETRVESDIRTLTENFIHQGHNIIVGDSAKYSTAFKDLAEKYAHVAFINISDDIGDAPQRPNLQSVYGRSYESQYLCGVVAGATSKKANIGFIALRSSPIVNWEINGYALGVRRANPDATVHVVFTGEASSAKERAAASALIDRGADVLGQSVDGPAPQIVAQERGVFATGHAVDLHELAPKSALCASIWVWDKYLTPEIKKIADGNWQADPNSVLLGQTRGGVDIACCSKELPEQELAKLLDERDRIIISGKQVFAGPLVDGEDKERVPAGGVLSDAELRAMDWYVKGVVMDR
jgi:basic membrane protein A and related proteins